jgi:glucosamine--fructose-6-phosphate aminotransferase (isomerizing)
MCGIVGVLTDHEAAPILVEALKRLEYRGYDSAGSPRSTTACWTAAALLENSTISPTSWCSSRCRERSGIGHTRWATHGGPTVSNAHPHRAGPRRGGP